MLASARFILRRLGIHEDAEEFLRLMEDEPVFINNEAGHLRASVTSSGGLQVPAYLIHVKNLPRVSEYVLRKSGSIVEVSHSNGLLRISFNRLGKYADNAVALWMATGAGFTNGSHSLFLRKHMGVYGGAGEAEGILLILLASTLDPEYASELTAALDLFSNYASDPGVKTTLMSFRSIVNYLLEFMEPVFTVKGP
ncbi:hypothetical protein [Caldivirga sp.]|uniref:hypothetical protein n=1 Tax=Caldivirga sp. TaxID=2080243 RepID=UPI003D0B5158